MRRLFLLRHAKSSWDDPGLDDHDRPLAPRGRRDAARMARHIAGMEDRPSLILCSSARRARQTLKPVAKALGENVIVSFEDSLYSFDAQALLARLDTLADDASSVMLVGHNPAMQELTLWLASGGEGLDRAREKFPTAGLATLGLDGPWSSLAERSALLLDFVSPRDLG